MLHPPPLPTPQAYHRCCWGHPIWSCSLVLHFANAAFSCSEICLPSCQTPQPSPNRSVPPPPPPPHHPSPTGPTTLAPAPATTPLQHTTNDMRANYLGAPTDERPNTSPEIRDKTNTISDTNTNTNTHQHRDPPSDIPTSSLVTLWLELSQSDTAA